MEVLGGGLGLSTKEVRGVNGVGVWKHIRLGSVAFTHHTRLVVGDGSRIYDVKIMP